MKEEKKTGKDRTQLATRNEDWTDDRLKNFLDVLPPEGIPAQYNILLRAYRGMTEELFERFIAIYTDAGHDINIALQDGSTFLDHLSRHRRSGAYKDVLISAGGKSGIS